MTVIHQVTDIHIPVTGDFSVRDNFTLLMQHVASAQPDILTFTGDLPGEDGSREAYLWICDQLPSDIPCLVLPGNHDDPAALFYDLSE
ncbi:MAG: metallophosphoesterase [Pseudomonadales bacterium]|nr:metallophosphoesterase [Pseudomonadales bacterium]